MESLYLTLHRAEIRLYHRQVMLLHVLMVKQNDPMTLSKHGATCGKGNKETGNVYALPVSQMLWNCLEDSREFYQPHDPY